MHPQGETQTVSTQHPRPGLITINSEGVAQEQTLKAKTRYENTKLEANATTHIIDRPVLSLEAPTSISSDSNEIPELRQSHSNSSIGTEDEARTSEESWARLSLASQTTISSFGSSNVVVDNLSPAEQKFNKEFLRAIAAVDITLVLARLFNDDARRKLSQHSIDAALLGLIKSPKHTMRELRHSRRQLQAVQFLLESCAPNVNHGDSDGRTPLMWAAIYDLEAIAELLIEKNADIFAKDKTKGRTPLLWAADRGSTKVADILLDHVSNSKSIQQIDLEGKSALSLAVRNMPPSVVGKLVNLGAQIEARDPNGRTPLMTAIEYRRSDTVKLLLDLGADRNAVDNSNVTAEDMAERCEYSILSLLFRRS